MNKSTYEPLACCSCGTTDEEVIGLIVTIPLCETCASESHLERRSERDQEMLYLVPPDDSRSAEYLLTLSGTPTERRSIVDAVEHTLARLGDDHWTGWQS